LAERRIGVRIGPELWREVEEARRVLSKDAGFNLSINDFCLRALKELVTRVKNQRVESPGSSLFEGGEGKH